MSGRSVVAIGGGHGLAMTLRALEPLVERLTAVVSTADNGGSSGRLRSTTPMPAPGDLRRCLDAVAGDRDLAAMMEHRFRDGPLAGHAVGNLVLAGMVDAGIGLDVAAARLGFWLGMPDHRLTVLPATTTPVDLVAERSEGELRGQVAIESSPGVVSVRIDPPNATVPAAAVTAIEDADLVVLGPGSLFASVLAAAVVPEIRSAVDRRKGLLVYVANLRAEEAGVRGLDVAGHVDVLRWHGIRPDVVVTQANGLPIGAMNGIRVEATDIDRPHGLAHDPDLLGPVLLGLLGS